MLDTSGDRFLPLLEVEDLRVYYRSEKGIVKAVDEVSFTLEKGESLCIVGESGSGKSTLALAVAGLIESPGEIAGGKVVFDGVTVVNKEKISTEDLLGRRITMVFQDPKSSLNPVMRIGDQISEILTYHMGLSKQDALQNALALLKEVQIPDPSRVINSYPHELSGGMAQRVMIAMAIATKPDLIIADEPTSALDVTVQAQILKLLKNVVRSRGSSLLLITHNLGVAVEMCERTVIMYAGKLVEECPTVELISNPLHPYTAALLEAIPRIGFKKSLKLAAGDVSLNPTDLPFRGCRFHPRCSYAMNICRREEPPLAVLGNRRVACFLHVSGSSA